MSCVEKCLIQKCNLMKYFKGIGYTRILEIKLKKIFYRAAVVVVKIVSISTTLLSGCFHCNTSMGGGSPNNLL